MSTRKKETSVNGEKRGTSPSLSPSHHLRSTPKPSKTSRSLDSSSSEKTIPNYLKPTLSSSSSGVTTKLQGKKTMLSNTDSAIKSNLARRRSFDKPPSPTRTPKTRGISPTPTFRSSSFSGKIGAGKAAATTTSPKGDRSLKGARDAGKQQHSLFARPVGTLKKSASNKSKKAETAIASSRKETKHDHNHHTTPDASDQDSSIAEGEEQTVIHDASEGKEHEEDSKVADQEMGNSNIEQSLGEVIDEDTISYKAESPTVLEQHDADADVDAAKVESPTILEQRDASIGKNETPTICEESDDNVVKVESPTLLGQNDASEQHDTDAEEAVPRTNLEQHEDADAAKVESPVSSEQHVESSTISEKVESEHEGDVASVNSPTVSEQQDASVGDKSCTEEMSSQHQEMKEHTADEMESTNTDHQSVAGDPTEEAEDKEKGEEEAEAQDKKAEVESGGEAHEVGAGEVQGVVVEDANAAPKVAHGKKDVALSNNVIEEMTREQRRNKVRALAGAFETVISLQEHK